MISVKKKCKRNSRIYPSLSLASARRLPRPSVSPMLSDKTSEFKEPHYYDLDDTAKNVTETKMQLKF